ncbi:MULTISPECIES: MarR family transcriptional regulator [unclassified Pseudonocardia]|uniref:MarR family winged helix-turn-helix transcriptional regulator n=1 Tax=unclassified Pseudonocardia TaxID=2619320 RepID=UPI0001FFE53F|nr:MULTISPECIES: MarR family transcriptional regulator [unclassified Pseudonocardia]ALE73126.1 MarR family transcriptional regulator [Pseudonocardia sp. EC080625-04]ALL76444.1 MarR family transcriptional regulator [Pseudonocardia sp. EC080610-09]ALL83471.1 MarR family transcriptional regulator [Pseudonocardia sp. EC080619-01]OLM19249.1 Transcriptional regulator, MarR family [Pseudonocardia sp. Ae707_Ps1]
MGGGTAREDLVALLQDYAGEAELLGQAFAGRHGLHPTDLHALLAVMRADAAGEPLTPGLLGSRLGLSTGATTALVDRLERAGHVRRTRESADRRRVTLHQAENAARVGGAFFGPLGHRMDAALADFDEAELTAAARFLTRMNALVADYRADLAAENPAS